MTAFPYAAIHAPLPAATVRRAARHLEALLRWQRELRGWPEPRAFARATPFVSVYGSNGLRGCAGVADGPLTTRAARAFLAAMNDARFARPTVDDELRASIAFVRAPRLVAREDFASLFEPGTDGAAIGRAIVLPDAAIVHRLDAERFLAAVVRKAGARAEGPLWIFRSEKVTAAPGVAPFREAPADAAAAWLAGMLGADAFAVDGRTGQAERRGHMYHARVATAVLALERHGGFPRVVAATRRALSRAPAHDAWPSVPAEIAATLALMTLAGVRGLGDALARVSPALAGAPWQAAQVVAALRGAAPAGLFESCVRSLDDRPWAPWTAIAARALGRADVLARASTALIASVRDAPPHEGGVASAPGRMPEVALTAIVVEALAGARSSEARRASTRARRFLARWQCRPDRSSPALDMRTARGAWPATPVDPTLRVDVTAHALLALLGSREVA